MIRNGHVLALPRPMKDNLKVIFLWWVVAPSLPSCRFASKFWLVYLKRASIDSVRWKKIDENLNPIPKGWVKCATTLWISRIWLKQIHDYDYMIICNDNMDIYYKMPHWTSMNLPMFFFFHRSKSHRTAIRGFRSDCDCWNDHQWWNIAVFCR
jgi:hypothetical protein